MKGIIVPKLSTAKGVASHITANDFQYVPRQLKRTFRHEVTRALNFMDLFRTHGNTNRNKTAIIIPASRNKKLVSTDEATIMVNAINRPMNNCIPVA